MGNKQTQPIREPTPLKSKRSSLISTPLQGPKISQNSFSKFMHCIGNLPFLLSEEEFDTIVYDVEERKYAPGTVILKEGQESPGIFVIVNGTCLLYASDGTTPLKTLETKQFFGEVSVFFKRQCTATVKCSDTGECTVVLLSKARAMELIENSKEPFDIPLVDWFKHNRYLDVSDILPFGSTSRAMIKESMLETTLFHNWPDESLNRVLDCMPAMPIELYPHGSFIYIDEDSDQNAYLILSGKVQLVHEDQVFELLPSEGLLIGEESLFTDCTRRCGARAEGPCQVVTISPSILQPVFENDPVGLAHLMSHSKRWKAFVNARDVQLLQSSIFRSEIELLSDELMKYSFFEMAPKAFLHLLVLSSVIKQMQPGHIAARKHNTEDVFVVVLGGMLYFEKSAGADSDSFDMIKYIDGDVVSIPHAMEKEVLLVVEETAVAATFYKSDLDDCLSSFPDTILQWETVAVAGT